MGKSAKKFKFNIGKNSTAEDEPAEISQKANSYPLIEYLSRRGMSG
jgi:hypothetical protein